MTNTKGKLFLHTSSPSGTFFIVHFVPLLKKIDDKNPAFNADFLLLS